MDEKTADALDKLVMALKAFTKSVQKNFHMGMYDGTGEMLIRQYNGLLNKARQLLPHNFFVHGILDLEQIKENTEDEKAISQIMIMSHQLLAYLQSVIENEQSYEAQHG